MAGASAAALLPPAIAPMSRPPGRSARRISRSAERQVIDRIERPDRNAQINIGLPKASHSGPRPRSPARECGTSAPGSTTATSAVASCRGQARVGATEQQRRSNVRCELPQPLEAVVEGAVEQEQVRRRSGPPGRGAWRADFGRTRLASSRALVRRPASARQGGDGISAAAPSDLERWAHRFRASADAAPAAARSSTKSHTFAATAGGKSTGSAMAAACAADCRWRRPRRRPAAAAWPSRRS